MTGLMRGLRKHGVLWSIPILLIAAYFGLRGLSAAERPIGDLAPAGCDVVLIGAPGRAPRSSFASNQIIGAAIERRTELASAVAGASFATFIDRLVELLRKPGGGPVPTPLPDAGDLLDGELAIFARLRSDAPPASHPQRRLFGRMDARPEFPFETLIFAARPRDWRIVTLLRVLAIPALFERIVAPHAPADWGIHNSGGIITVSNPAMLVGGLPWRPPHALHLAIRDGTILVSTRRSALSATVSAQKDPARAAMRDDGAVAWLSASAARRLAARAAELLPGRLESLVDPADTGGEDPILFHWTTTATTCGIAWGPPNGPRVMPVERPDLAEPCLASGSVSHARERLSRILARDLAGRDCGLTAAIDSVLPDARLRFWLYGHPLDAESRGMLFAAPARHLEASGGRSLAEPVPWRLSETTTGDGARAPVLLVAESPELLERPVRLAAETISRSVEFDLALDTRLDPELTDGDERPIHVVDALRLIATEVSLRVVGRSGALVLRR